MEDFLSKSIIKEISPKIENIPKSTRDRKRKLTIYTLIHGTKDLINTQIYYCMLNVVLVFTKKNRMEW